MSALDVAPFAPGLLERLAGPAAGLVATLTWRRDGVAITLEPEALSWTLSIEDLPAGRGSARIPADVPALLLTEPLPAGNYGAVVLDIGYQGETGTVRREFLVTSASRTDGPAGTWLELEFATAEDWHAHPAKTTGSWTPPTTIVHLWDWLEALNASGKLFRPVSLSSAPLDWSAVTSSAVTTALKAAGLEPGDDVLDVVTAAAETYPDLIVRGAWRAPDPGDPQTYGAGYNPTETPFYSLRVDPWPVADPAQALDLGRDAGLSGEVNVTLSDQDWGNVLDASAEWEGGSARRRYTDPTLVAPYAGRIRAVPFTWRFRPPGGVLSSSWAPALSKLARIQQRTWRGTFADAVPCLWLEPGDSVRLGPDRVGVLTQLTFTYPTATMSGAVRPL